MEQVQSSFEMNQPHRGRLTRFGALLEMLVLLSLIVPSSLFASTVYTQARVSFRFVATATMVRDLALVVLLLFFIWRNGESLRAIGWRFRGLDVILGVVCFIPFIFFTSGLTALFQLAGLSAPPQTLPSFLMPKGGLDIVIALLLIIVVAVSEETIFRGYLLLRLQGLGTGIAAAVILSSFIFASGHNYEGTAGMATVGVMGIVFSLLYLWRKSLVVPIVMHFLQDFMGLIVAPHLR